MNNCRKCSSMFVEALYEELNPQQKEWFKIHLRSCPKCANKYEKVKTTVSIMDKRSRPEPDQFFWDSYWERLADQIETEEQSVLNVTPWLQRFWQGINLQPSLTYRVATAVALIAIGIFIGKLYFGRPVSQHVENIQAENISPTAVEKVSLQQRTNHYIERSKILLLGLVNFDPDGGDTYALNLPYQKKISQQLVDEASFLKEELTEPGQQQLRDLIEDLEIILLQIANLESEHDISGIELVKSGVDRRGILLKINLEEMREDLSSSGNNIDRDKI